ncbi:aquaporin-like protein [Syncephalis plumigaleata]|nr:aquaporin-like protein [Syncephalis plumigaleata]
MSKILEGPGATAVMGGSPAIAPVEHMAGTPYISGPGAPAAMPQGAVSVPVGSHMVHEDKVNAAIRTQRLLREYLGELLGTWVFISIGVGVNAQYAISVDDKETFFPVNFAWGFGVMMGVYVTAGVSGGHINPAVSLAFFLFRDLSFWKMLGFWGVQLCGAYLGTAFTYLCWLPSINHYDGHIKKVEGPTGTGNIFYTLPQTFYTNGSKLWSEIYATAILIIFVLAVTDRKNNPLVGPLAPIIIGFAVTALLLSFGSPFGIALNPTRDLGPRLFALSAGYGAETFNGHHTYFWVPVFGPLFGAILGGLMYIILIRPQLRDAVVTQSREGSRSIHPVNDTFEPSYGTPRHSYSRHVSFER